MPNVSTPPAAAPSPAPGSAIGAVGPASPTPLPQLPPSPPTPPLHGHSARATAAAPATPSSAASHASLDWSTIDLVIFDVDGTLYDQRKLRWAMLKLLLQHAWQTRSLDTLLTLRAFRQVREALGHQPGADFLRLQYAQAASRRGKSPTEVREMTFEWMESRPLPLLADCRYPHVAELFAGLRAAGKQIAVFSDYPAGAKLVALGLNNVTPARAAAGQADPYADQPDTQPTLDAGDSEGDSSDFGDFWKTGELDEPGEMSADGQRAATAQTPGAQTHEAAETNAKAKPGTERGMALNVDFGLPPPVEIRPIGPIVCATDADIARLKPDPAGLLAILRLTGVPPGRALMIGDRFDRDALAAERAGVRCLIRGRKPLTAGAHPRAQTFDAYDDPLFKPLLPG